MLLTAVGCGLAAGLLARPVRALVATPSRWLRPGVPAVLAAAGGVGATAVAGSAPELVGVALLAVGCALLVVVDLVTLRLPDLLVGPLYVVLPGCLAVAAATGAGWDRFGAALATGGLGLLGYFVLAYLAPRDLGLGDVKLSGVLGVFLGWLGWSQAVLGLLAGFALGGLVAAALLLIRRRGSAGAFPFGPCMILGAAAGAGLGPVLLTG